MSKHPVEKISVKHFVAASILFIWGMLYELTHPTEDGIKAALIILCVSAVFYAYTICKMFWRD